MYGRKNLRILYDAISTLCDAIGGALAEVRATFWSCTLALHLCLAHLYIAKPY